MIEITCKSLISFDILLLLIRYGGVPLIEFNTNYIQIFGPFHDNNPLSLSLQKLEQIILRIKKCKCHILFVVSCDYSP